jgi:hypothetical protein
LGALPGLGEDCTVTVCLHVSRSASEFTLLTSGDRRRAGTLLSAAITSSRREEASCSAWQLFPAAAAVAICDARPAH